ncbi:MAG: sulfotransferase domain-containing protein [Ruegeria sp.]
MGRQAGFLESTQYFEKRLKTMFPIADTLAPALLSYRGSITDPNRWSTWHPRLGDILICTPPKSGTTWTQTMVAMLIHEKSTLPEAVHVMSPWVDANLGVPANEVAAALARQNKRRVVKTHTPADGFPLWDGVKVISVYRHPLDVFFSLRKHNANVNEPDGDEPMCWPLDKAFRYFIEEDAYLDDFDRDKLATVTRHYSQTVLSGRIPNLKTLHYADLLQNSHRAVEIVANAAEIDVSAKVIEDVASATSFSSMKSKAAEYAPVGGTGFWKSDAKFFDSASSGKWHGVLSDDQVNAYSARLKELVPDDASRAWLEFGNAATSRQQG